MRPRPGEVITSSTSYASRITSPARQEGISLSIQGSSQVVSSAVSSTGGGPLRNIEGTGGVEGAWPSLLILLNSLENRLTRHLRPARLSGVEAPRTVLAQTSSCLLDHAVIAFCLVAFQAQLHRIPQGVRGAFPRLNCGLGLGGLDRLSDGSRQRRFIGLRRCRQRRIDPHLRLLPSACTLKFRSIDMFELRQCKPEFAGIEADPVAVFQPYFLDRVGVTEPLGVQEGPVG